MHSFFVVLWPVNFDCRFLFCLCLHFRYTKKNKHRKKTEKKKNVRKISERKKAETLLQLFVQAEESRWQKRQWLRDTRNNRIFLLFFFISRRHRSIFYGNLTTDQINMCADSISFFRSFDFDWNALACSCCGRYVQIKQSNTIVDRSTKMHWMWSVQKKKRNGQRAAEHHQNQQQPHTRSRKKSVSIRPNRKHCVQIKLTEEMRPLITFSPSLCCSRLLRLTLIGSI